MTTVSEPTLSEQCLYLGQLSLQLEHSESPDRPIVTAILTTLTRLRDSRPALKAGAIVLEDRAKYQREFAKRDEAESGFNDQVQRGVEMCAKDDDTHAAALRLLAGDL